MNKLKDGKEYEDYIIKHKYKLCYLWNIISLIIF